MKKIEYYSDIHNEFRKDYWLPFKFIEDDKSETILILAGDVDSRPVHLNNYIRMLALKYHHIIFVPGNHEYYRHNFSEYRDTLMSMFDNVSNVTVADRNTVVIEGYVFICGTLWTDMYNASLSKTTIRNYVNDFNLISSFNVTIMVEEYMKTVSYINEELDKYKDNIKIVVTHFPPSLKCKHKKWGTNIDVMSHYFYPTVDVEIVNKANYWIYGHSHDNVTVIEDGCDIVSNQLAYPNENIQTPITYKIIQHD